MINDRKAEQSNDRKLRLSTKVAQGTQDEQTGKKAPKSSSTPFTKKHRKKDKNLASRPLSAYNIFFKEERPRILEEIAKEAPREDYLAKWKLALARSKGSVASAKFQAIATTIASRWNALSAEDRIPYEKQAAVELELYKKRKETCRIAHLLKCQQAAKMAVSTGADTASQMGHGQGNPAMLSLPSLSSKMNHTTSALLGSLPVSALALQQQQTVALLATRQVAPTTARSVGEDHDDAGLLLLIRQAQAQQDLMYLNQLEGRIKLQRDILQSRMMQNLLLSGKTFNPSQHPMSFSSSVAANASGMRLSMLQPHERTNVFKSSY